ncbi:MAG: hypothetical protein EKK53_12340 [Burkholderiales bacterium]|nr:MAG: hypothetical protein EKK53_12340 [Burkholderiales bacterium]
MSLARRDRQFDRLELAATAYLGLPLLPFLWAWWRWPVTVLAGVLLAVTARAVFARHRRESPDLGAGLWLVLLAVALLWVASSGLLGGLPLNEDWSVRMRVLRDLTVGAWPVGYGPGPQGDTMLRFSMGYYLVPAGLGALTGGVEAARGLLGVWTALGVLLALALVMPDRRERQPRAVALVIALFVGFSGMDLVGFLLGRAATPALGEHIEWWTPWLQYSSQTTLLFWVPNHALPAWLAAAVVWRHRAAGLAPAPAAILLTAAAFWSPLACVSLLPLLVLATMRGQGLADWLRELARPAVLAMLPVLALLAAFVSFGIVVEEAPADRQALADVVAPTASWHAWLVFQLLEWGLVAGVLMSAGWHRVGWTFRVACALLLLLPLLRFGPGNDLVMRAGIAPLTLLLLCTAQALQRRQLAPAWQRVAWVVLLVGCATPAQELIRQTQPGARWPDDGRSLAQAQGRPWHYVGVLRPGLLTQALRPPVVLR